MDGTIAIIGLVTISYSENSSDNADLKALRAFRVVRSSTRCVSLLSHCGMCISKDVTLRSPFGIFFFISCLFFSDGVAVKFTHLPWQNFAHELTCSPFIMARSMHSIVTLSDTPAEDSLVVARAASGAWSIGIVDTSPGSCCILTGIYFAYRIHHWPGVLP